MKDVEAYTTKKILKRREENLKGRRDFKPMPEKVRRKSLYFKKGHFKY